MRITESSPEIKRFNESCFKYKTFTRLPDSCRDKVKFKLINKGMSAFYSFREYHKGQLSVLTDYVADYNRRYPVEFKIFKHRDCWEVARIS